MVSIKGPHQFFGTAYWYKYRKLVLPNWYGSRYKFETDPEHSVNPITMTICYQSFGTIPHNNCGLFEYIMMSCKHCSTCSLLIFARSM